VRHLCKIRNHGAPFEVFPQGNGQRSANVAVLPRLEHLAECHHLRFRVGNFNSHCSFPRNRCNDSNALRTHGQREIVCEIGELADFHAGRRLDLELRYNRTRGAPDELSLHTESAERIHELLPHRVELALAEISVARRRGRQQIR
jgi:hypothetical protein